MAKHLNIKKVLRKNPQVDRKLLAETQSLAIALRRLGQPDRPMKRLAAPFERKRATITRTKIELAAD